MNILKLEINMEKLEELKLNGTPLKFEWDLSNLFRALASKTRFRIIKLLLVNDLINQNRDKNVIKNTLDVSRIARKLKQTEANISAQIKILEKTGIIKSHYEPGEHGVRKVSEISDLNLVLFIFQKLIALITNHKTKK